jgi:ribosomal protein S18 acetylase RimI-like enzyme
VAEPRIRPYRPADLDALYDICLRTGAAGEDASDLMGDPRLLGDLYAAPYAHLEPELAFVVDDGAGTAAGYVLGARDTRAFEAACERVWWPALRNRHPMGSGTGVLDDVFIALVHDRRPQADEIVAAYPSHLHIDLLPSVQGYGFGRRLMERLFAALRAAGSTGVHLGVSHRNERAIGFYEHLGFEVLRADDLGCTVGLRL